MFLSKMPMLIAKKSSGQCCHGNGSSSCYSRVFWVAVVCFVVQHITGQSTSNTDGNKIENKAEKSTPSFNLNLHPNGQTNELELTIIQDDNLTLNMNEASMVRVNVTLHCVHPSVAYSIRLSTEDPSIAVVEDFEVFSITCADLVFPRGLTGNGLSLTLAPGDPSSSRLHPENSSNGENDLTHFGVHSIPVAQEGFNFTLHADLLGRTWLHVFGERYADPEVVIPHFLKLPWNDTQASSTELPLTVSESPEEDHETLPGNSDPESSHADSGVPYDTVSHDDGVINTNTELEKHLVTVIRIFRPVDYAFRGILYGFVIMATIGMGCKTEMPVVKGVLKKPIAPAIGFVCQYLFMPLIAFLLAKTVVVGNPAVSLGIFTCGICPGGGPSNFFTYLLDGDVSLSVTMTAISSVAALAMIPLWLFTLGTQFEDDKIDLQVPFGRILMTLAIIIIPLFIGLAVKKWAPKVAMCILKVLKPFTLLAIVFLLTFGVYANLYVFRLFSVSTILAACLLPYIGYLLGATISLILRQPCYRVKTIAIETGIQNTSIAYLLLVFSLPDPDGDLAAVAPMASAIMTPLPLFLLVLVYLLYKRCCAKKKDSAGGEGGEEEVALREEDGVRERNGNVTTLEDGGRRNSDRDSASMAV